MEYSGSSSDPPKSHSTNNTISNPYESESERLLKQRENHNRVKFSVGAEDSQDDSDHDFVPEQLRGIEDGMEDLPRITCNIDPDNVSQDVTSASGIRFQTPKWSEKTRTSQFQAHNRASKLASRMGGSAPGSRRNSVGDIEDSSSSDSTFMRPANPQSKYTSDPISNQASAQLPKPRPKGLLSDLQKKWQRFANADPATVYQVSPNTSSIHLPISSVTTNEMVPLVDLESQSRPYTLYAESSDNDSDDTDSSLRKNKKDTPGSGARRFARSVTNRFPWARVTRSGQHSGTTTPTLDKELHDGNYIEPPTKYNQGKLASPMELHGDLGASIQRSGSFGNFDAGAAHHQKTHEQPASNGRGTTHRRSQSDTPSNVASSSGYSSGKATPRRKPKWYDYENSPNGNLSPGSRTRSAGSLTNLLPTVSTAPPDGPDARPTMHRSRSSVMIAEAVERIKHPAQMFKGSRQLEAEEGYSIKVHIEAVMFRQKYLVKLCRALMIYGAPTHRLEEYMRFSARALQIDGQFLYLPGCMVVSFDDPESHATEVKLVKELQGIDLGKFKDTFTVYKNVIHDVWGVEEATRELEEIMKRPAKFKTWVRVLVYGMASMSVGPFAFGARPIDFPITFALGCLLGFLQLIVAPRSDEFQHIFEVAIALIMSFAARAFGSIRYDGEYLFCFSAIAQSSIALILPGYIILCASLELQSRSLVAGSVRMVYAIIYALLLGFGITIGTAVFGLMYPKATHSVTCTVPWYWKNPYLTHYPFVLIFTSCLIVINQAKWRQAPMMLGIGFAGYLTNFWSSKRLANNVQVANALGAFVVGCLANLNSRIFRGLAAAAMLPAIFVQVPSGLAASGSLVAGLTSADQITGNATGTTVVNNGTTGFLQAANSTATASSNSVYGGTIFNVGYGMVQVAIGISVGLFLSALVSYPFGKKRSGLFTF